MTRFILVLLLALVFEAVGVVFLSKGLRQAGKFDELSWSAAASVVKRAVSSGYVWLGVAFEAVFFAGLLYLLARADVSFIWPLTSLGFVLTTFSARVFLNEQVSVSRWAGVVLIMAGAALVSWSENVKREPHTMAALQEGIEQEE